MQSGISLNNNKGFKQQFNFQENVFVIPSVFFLLSPRVHLQQ